MRRVEYCAGSHSLSATGLSFTAWLNSMGEAGWIMCGVERGVFYFYRELL